MGEFQVTEQIFSTKQNQNIKEELTGALSILDIRPGYWSLNGKWPFTVFFMGEIDLFLSRLHRSVVRPTKPPCNAGYQNAR